MVISEKMQTALNKQVNRELYSSFLYLSMSGYFEAENLKGFAAWMKEQAKEEYAHAMKMYNYVFERGGKVELLPIEAPPKEWDSILNVFEETYKHELEVTKEIHNLVGLSKDENDYATESFLKWYVDEQVEEEDQASYIVERLKQIAGFKGGIIFLDKELGARAQH